MKKIVIICLSLMIGSTWAAAQTYMTKTAQVSFLSKGGVEVIQAKNSSAVSTLNTETGEIQFAILMKAFIFDKALMQEHFNENYVESHKYPKATFKGVITNLKEVNFAKEGSYPAKVTGTMNMHGVQKTANATGYIYVKGGKINATSDFNILLSDYKISIPKAVQQSISNTVNIHVEANLDSSK